MKCFLKKKEEDGFLFWKVLTGLGTLEWILFSWAGESIKTTEEVLKRMLWISGSTDWDSVKDSIDWSGLYEEILKTLLSGEEAGDLAKRIESVFWEKLKKESSLYQYQYAFLPLNDSQYDYRRVEDLDLTLECRQGFLFKFETESERDSYVSKKPKTIPVSLDGLLDLGWQITEAISIDEFQNIGYSEEVFLIYHKDSVIGAYPNEEDAYKLLKLFPNREYKVVPVLADLFHQQISEIQNQIFR